MNINSKLPNFFIVGAAKAGTTSIYSYLDKHPDIFMSPIKEPHYFSKDIRCNDFTQKECMNACFDIKEYLSHSKLEKKHIAFIENIQDYAQLFRDVTSENIIAETSTGYLYSNLAAQEIYNFNPDAKILIVLRNPVQRAYSHWKMNLAAGREQIDDPFFNAMDNDAKSISKGYCKSHLYVELGQYSEQIKRYSNLFPKKNIKVLFFEDLKNDSNKFMDQVYKFLSLAPLAHKADTKENVSTIIKFNWLKQFNKKFNISKLIPKGMKDLLKKLLSTTNFPKLTIEEKTSMYSKYFKNDIEKLETQLNVDLSLWKYGKKQTS